jgi:hypothetical protein
MSDPTITWSVVSLECYESFAGFENVVRYVHWRCTASGAGLDEETVTASRTGTVELPLHPLDPFILFDDLTEETVLGWVWPRINVADVDSGVRLDWAIIRDLPLIAPPLPWADDA